MTDKSQAYAEMKEAINVSCKQHTFLDLVYKLFFRAVRDYYILVAAIYSFSNLANLAVYNLPN